MVANLRSFSLVAVTFGALVFAGGTRAQSLSDRRWIEASAYWPSIDTSVSISSVEHSTIGTEIDLEKDLNLDDSQVLPAFVAGARWGDHWSVIGEYYGLNRDGSKTIGRDITFDDVTFNTSAVVDSKFDTDVYRLAVGYAFIRNDSFELGGSLGLHATDFDLELSGDGQVAGAPVQSEIRKHQFLAPLPTIGLFSSWEVAPRVTLGARVDYLSLTVDDFDGRLINSQVSATWRALDNVGIGIMYRYVDYKLGVTKKRWTGDVDYTFSGPSIYAEYAF